MKNIFKILIIIALCLLFSIKNASAQTNDCSVFKHAQRFIDSISMQLDGNYSLLFSIEYIKIKDTENFFICITIDNSLKNLLLSEQNYYLEYKNNFIVVHNYSNKDINGDIQQFFCAFKPLDETAKTFINNKLEQSSSYKIPQKLENLWYIRKDNGLKKLLIWPKWFY